MKSFASNMLTLAIYITLLNLFNSKPTMETALVLFVFAIVAYFCIWYKETRPKGEKK